MLLAADPQRIVLPAAVADYEALVKTVMKHEKGGPSVEDLYITGKQTIDLLHSQYAEDAQGRRIQSGNTDLLLFDALTENELQGLNDRLQGFHISRGAARIHIRTDTEFFKRLAKKYGGPADKAYFSLLAKRTVDDAYPKFEIVDSNFGTCVDYGTDGIVSAYRDWDDFRKKYPESYKEGVERRMAEIKLALTRRLCACGSDKAAVTKEFRDFLSAFPKAEFSDEVLATLHDIDSGISTLRLDCHPG